MKFASTYSIPKLMFAAIAFAVASSSAVARKDMPDITHEGLERIKGDGIADYIYVHPDADLGGYKKVMLAEPQISFRRFWQQNVNSGRRLNRISDSDIEKMIATGKELLLTEFTDELKKGDITLAEKAEGDVLLVKAMISDLSITAPDPNNMAGIWSSVYAESAGEATLTIEVYDSVTEQVLVRAIDTKIDVGDAFGWRERRTHYTNVNDARTALNSWAKDLVKGLRRAMSAKSN
jgi:hypothetical protein